MLPPYIWEVILMKIMKNLNKSMAAYGEMLNRIGC